MPDTPQELASALHAARFGDTRLPPQQLGSLQAAYAVQTALDELEDSPIIGLKIGATLQGALDTLGLAAPFHGRLRAAHHHVDGAVLALPRSHPVNIETEFVVGFASDLRLDPHYHDVRSIPDALLQQVAGSVAFVGPGFEFVGSRIDMGLPGNGAALIADAAGNVATVLGTAIPGAHRQLDLADCTATLSINGDEVASGSGSDSLAAHPLAMVAWLLGQPGPQARGVKSGEVVFCGTCTGALPVSPGDVVSADFGALGRVHATLE